MSTRELIEEAMRGVRIVICDRCNGLGVVGLATLQTTCPDCRGCGETTVRDGEVTDANVVRPDGS